MENQEKNYQSFNNEIILDLILKSTKLTTFLTNLLDINNIEKLDKEIISSEEYNKIQEHIIQAITTTSTIFKDQLLQLEIKSKEENIFEQEKTN